MKTMKTTPQELHSFLILASTVLKKESKASMTALRSLHNIPIAILDHLVAEGIISLNGKGRGAIWKWTGKVSVSKEVAEILLSEVIKGRDSRIEKRRKQSIKKGEKIAATFSEKSRSSADVQFDNMLAGIDPFTVESVPVYAPSKPVFKAHKTPPQPVYKAPEPVYAPSKPVFKAHKTPPQPVYKAPQPVYAPSEPVYAEPERVNVEATTKEALEPLKKKSYGITKLLWGRIVLRTNYYE